MALSRSQQRDWPTDSPSARKLPDLEDMMDRAIPYFNLDELVELVTLPDPLIQFSLDAETGEINPDNTRRFWTPPSAAGTHPRPNLWVDGSIHQADLPPLEVVASELTIWGLSRQASELVSVYDEFLLGMNDPARRTALNEVKPQDAANHKVFLEFREVSGFRNC